MNRDRESGAKCRHFRENAKVCHARFALHVTLRAQWRLSSRRSSPPPPLSGRGGRRCVSHGHEDSHFPRHVDAFAIPEWINTSLETNQARQRADSSLSRVSSSQASKTTARTPVRTRAGLFSLKKTSAPAAPPAPEPRAETEPAPPPPYFHAVPSSYFSYEQQTVRGPRANADVGTPVDASRRWLSKDIQNGQASCGSWGCTEGGWLSPKPRTSTEWFYILSGRGSVQTPDSREFRFGPGDLVVLPRGWAGRWDVQERIHKIWVIHEHEDIRGADAEPVVATRTRLSDFETSLRDADGMLFRGTAVYDVGGTRAGSWCASPGSFSVTARPVAECFTVVKGAMFLTNPDGSARRCGVGDTVNVPEGWAGKMDVVEEVITVFVEIAKTGSQVTGAVATKYVDSGSVSATPHEAISASIPVKKDARRGGAGTGSPIYEVGAPLPVPSWGWNAPAASERSREADTAKYQMCLAVLESSDDPDLVAAAKAKLLSYLE